MKNPFIGESVRTHDLLYLQPTVDVKEYFKFILANSEEELKAAKEGSVIDIGCANGTFLRYLDLLFPGRKLTGLDILGPLLNKAKENIPTARFVEADINTVKAADIGQFDCLFMNGVHGMFDDCSTWLSNVTKLIRSGGTGFIFGPFNNADIDVITRVRKSGESGPYENGWNTISRASFRKVLADSGVRHVDFFEFEMPFDIEPREDDPMRSWTIRLEGGRRIVVNGASLIRPQALAKFRKD